MHPPRSSVAASISNSKRQQFWMLAGMLGSDECWQWSGVVSSNGYGRFSLSKSVQALAHRLAWELSMGPIPDGMTIDHLCRSKTCCNPSHLEPVTLEENHRRYREWQAARVVTCKRGHTRTGGRRCMPCRQAYDRSRGKVSVPAHLADADPASRGDLPQKGGE